MTDYEKVLMLVKYPTLNELYELEHSELSSFVVHGMKYIIQHSLNLTKLDSIGMCYGEKSNSNNTVVKIYTSFEFVKEKPVEDFVDLGDVIKFKIFEHNLSISSSKVLFVEINKVYLKQLYLFSRIKK